MFFVPGNVPGKITKAAIYGADCVIYDLEDAVSINEKDAARDLIRHFLMEYRPDCRIGIRINAQDTPYYEEDVKMMVPLKPDFLRLPKSETAENIKNLDKLIAVYEQKSDIPIGTIKIVATIETALGVYNAFQIASASKRVLAIGLGAEDFRTDMCMSRTEEGKEILFARNLIALAAHAANVMPIDYVYSNFNNIEGFTTDVTFGKMIGFTGKSVIHPNQIQLVHAIYNPTDEEINDAKKILTAYEAAIANASGVIALEGKMLDKPIVDRAKNILAYAGEIGKKV
jgi:citrate lyase subunit beta / citryl-CoA lyase